MQTPNAQPPTSEQVQGWKQAYHTVAAAAVADILASLRPAQQAQQPKSAA